MFRAQPGAIHHVTVLSQHVLGCYQHYDGANTVPCIGLENRCRGCQEYKDRRWYGYLAVQLNSTGKRCILQLTAGAVDSCPSLGLHDGELRGRELIVRRRAGGKNAPVTLQMSLHRRPEPLPEAFDVREALLAIWFVRNRPGQQPPPDPRA